MRWPTGRPPACRERLVRPRLSVVVDHVLACCDIRSMGAGARGVAYPNDGERQYYLWGHRPDCRGPVPVDTVQGRMFVVLPNADRIHCSFWVSPRADWRLGARLSPWSLLHRLLLGRDGALVCRRRHESLLDRCPFGIGVDRKGGAIWSACPANCRDCLYSKRSVVADPKCLIPLLAHERVRCTCPLLAPKRTSLIAPHMSAFGGRADAFCTCRDGAMVSVISRR